MPKWLWVTVLMVVIAGGAMAWWAYKPSTPETADASPVVQAPAAPLVPTLRDGVAIHSGTPASTTTVGAGAPAATPPVAAATTVVPSAGAPRPAAAPVAPVASASGATTAGGAATPGTTTQHPRPTNSNFAKGMQLVDSGFAGIVEGRQMLSDMLDSSATSNADAAAIRDALARANQSALFGPRAVPNDPFTEMVTVQRGENLTRIARRYKIPYQTVEMINGIDSRRLQAGQQVKVIKGPFHAVVSKSEYRVDLFLHGADGKRVYARSFSVGLGEANSTPTGHFMIKQGGKVEGGGWTNPRTGESFAPGDPKNPIGRYWMTLQGIDDKTQTIRGYGIHGTIEPNSIGKQMSMGCVRLGDEDIATLYKLLTDGQSMVVIEP